MFFQVHKAVDTSPIQEGDRRPGQHPPSAHPSAPTPTPATKTGAQFTHPRKGGPQVRFLPDRPSLEKQKDQESSESETENTTNDEEAHTTEKFLLLTDQLSVDTKKHLSIKDIGVILDRLSSKIIDVEKLDREIEEEDCFNWTIKATIRGDTLRELGVIYNGHFYSISEHPGYGQKKEEEEEDVTEEKEAEKEPVWIAMSLCLLDKLTCCFFGFWMLIPSWCTDWVNLRDVEGKKKVATTFFGNVEEEMLLLVKGTERKGVCVCAVNVESVSQW